MTGFALFGVIVASFLLALVPAYFMAILAAFVSEPFVLPDSQESIALFAFAYTHGPFTILFAVLIWFF